jgi:hypothetical protein
MSCRKRGKAEHIKPALKVVSFCNVEVKFHDGKRPDESRREEKDEAPGRSFELRQALQAFL